MLIRQEDLWASLEPGIKHLIDKVIGLGPWAKDMMLQQIKSDIWANSYDWQADMKDGTIDTRINILVNRWFDKRNCGTCSHNKVCKKLQFIEEMRSMKVKVRFECDDWKE